MGHWFAIAWPFAAIISVQFGYSMLTILAKGALDGGMNMFVFVAYRHVVASVVLVPFALLMERNVRPRMTLPIFLKIMLLGLLEPVADQGMFYTGMKLTSAASAAAICNILPSLSFIMACIFGLERVNLKERRSQAKVAGTLISMSGAMVMALYLGPTIPMPWPEAAEPRRWEPTADGGDNMLKGSVLVIAACCCWAGSVILQTFVLKDFPAELSLAALVCVTGTVQGALVAFVGLRGVNGSWAIRVDKGLLLIIYAGIVCSGLSYYLQGLVIKKRGPVFATSFGPLGMIIVAILGSFILGEELHLGRVIGAVIIVAGLYSIVWGMNGHNN